MATIVNTTPSNGDASGSNTGILIIAIFLILLIIGGLYFGLPRGGGSTNTPAAAPTTESNDSGTSGQPTQVNIPDKIDVNVNQQPNQ